MFKRVYTGVGNSHFVTFRCAGKRKLLEHPAPRQIVISVLSGLVDKGKVEVVAFVVMPDHVHALMWYPNGDSEHSKVVQTLKRLSSHCLIKYFDRHTPGFTKKLTVVRNDRKIRALWTRRFYDMNVDCHKKVEEAIEYIQNNPVKAGVVADCGDWKWGSAPWYFKRVKVGVKIRPGF
jgi:REP-associated tyrosine transposase